METNLTEDFKKEMKQYTIEELELIKETQQHLYTKEEMYYIGQTIRYKKKREEERIKKALPKEIKCPKCEGINSFKNDSCEFCKYDLKRIKAKYYDEDFKKTLKSRNNDDSIDDFSFQHILSFLIPLIGFILGAILLSRKDKKEIANGKACVFAGIAGTIIFSVIWMIIIK